jgi:flagellar biosynthesis protein FlhG
MKDPVIISIGGGKGGIGKSTITANLGAALTSKGYSIGYIDADLGGANLHLCLGVKRPQAGLQDYISGKYKKLDEIAVKTAVSNSWLVSGASDFLELANPNYAQKQKIITNLKKMTADFILVDLGAGSDYHVTDFYAAFPYGIVVADALPTSIENAYGFLKNGTIRGLVRLFSGKPEIQNRIKRFADPVSKKEYATVNDFLGSLINDFGKEVEIMREWLHTKKNLLIINMVKNSDDIKVGTRFAEMVRKYLSINLHYIGYVVYAPEVRTSIKEMRPIVMKEEPSQIKDCFDAITQNLISLTRGQPS